MANFGNIFEILLIQKEWTPKSFAYTSLLGKQIASVPTKESILRV